MKIAYLVIATIGIITAHPIIGWPHKTKKDRYVEKEEISNGKVEVKNPPLGWFKKWFVSGPKSKEYIVPSTKSPFTKTDDQRELPNDYWNIIRDRWKTSAITVMTITYYYLLIKTLL